jgi:hypothetical protein
MKKIVTPVLLVTCLVTACRKNVEPKPEYNLGVSMHANFEEDTIKVYIDNQLLFIGAVSTDPEWSMAKSISTTANQGSHSIKVIVNNNTVATDQFNQNGNLDVGISYDKAAQKISFAYTN